MITTILITLVYSFIVATFLGGWVGIGSIYVSVLCMIIVGVAITLCAYETVLIGNNFMVELWSWILLDRLSVSISFSLNRFEGLMGSMIAVVMICVLLYSLSYMSGDVAETRFIGLIGLFGFSMLVLLFSNNYLLLFIGWEGVGLCSYLLVSHWFRRSEAVKAGVQAMMVNKIGDVCMFIALLICMLYEGGIEFEIVGLNLTSRGILWLAYMGFIFGMVSKSAQVGLHIWLPNAMEGPSPVSALIHAATMVTAGVILMARCEWLLIHGAWLVTLIGILSAICSGSLALLQSDMKRIVAYSTGSQLGYMVFAVGLGCLDGGIGHMINHGFFKAVLFLGCGLVLHGLVDSQDVRLMGGLVKLFPVAYVGFLGGMFGLIGFPGSSGFHSKDLIMLAAISEAYEGGLMGVITFSVALIGVFVTALYSGKFLVDVFLGTARVERSVAKSIHEVRGLVVPFGVLVMLGCAWSIWGQNLLLGLTGGVNMLAAGSRVFDDIEFFGRIQILVTLVMLCGLSCGFVIAFKFQGVRYAIVREVIKIGVYRGYYDRLIGVASSWFSYSIAAILVPTLDKGLHEVLGGSGWSQRASIMFTWINTIWSFGVIGYLIVIFVPFSLLVLLWV